MEEWVWETDLSAFIYKDELDSLVCFGDRGYLGRYPAQLLVGEPDPGALGVYVFGHEGERRPGRRVGRNKSSAQES